MDWQDATNSAGKLYAALANYPIDTNSIGVNAPDGSGIPIPVNWEVETVSDSLDDIVSQSLGIVSYEYKDSPADGPFPFHLTVEVDQPSVLIFSIGYDPADRYELIVSHPGTHQLRVLPSALPPTITSITKQEF